MGGGKHPVQPLTCTQHISELYGVLDPVTRTWTDGLFSNIFRTINKVSDKEGADRERKYVLFDGDQQHLGPG